MDAVQLWAPLCLSLGALTLLGTLLPSGPGPGRMMAAMLCSGLAIRYIAWRYTTSMPTQQSDLQMLWAWTFFVVEALSMAGNVVIYGFMSRRIDRSAQADARQNSPLHDAPVDVFIATYNENATILERTIVCASSIDHADLRVWVLDDGAREWVRDLTEELGAHYVQRVKGKHAKAGNVNNGLARALATDRRPEFVLLLDADFCAGRNILKRTLGLFEEADVGIVQTPQHFFNHDPVQANLLCASVWPDEQRFFFNELLPCKDAWGAAFCCGTSAVMRVAALLDAGGMATETVTEDMLTSYKIAEYGWRTILLNEELSLGLAPEGLQEYVTQRGRWCLGAIQQIYTRWSFSGRGRLTLANRISCLDTVLYWAFSFPFKIMMIAGPLVFWWTGTAVMVCSIDDMVYWMAPSVVASISFMLVYASKRVLPVMTDVTQLLSSFVVMATVATALVKPFGRPFKVTAKGVSSDRITVQWRLMLPFAAMAAATILGVVVNLSPYSMAAGSPGYTFSIFWSLFNVVVLLLTATVCIELPRRRKDERFLANEPASIMLDNGEMIACTINDISIGGARVTPPAAADLHSLAGAELVMDDGRPIVPVIRARSVGADLALRFAESTSLRRALIAKLFTGGYRNEVRSVTALKVAATLARKLLG